MDQASERVWGKDKRFLLPLYVFVATNTLNWLWCLFVVGEVNPLRDTPYAFVFENKHGHSILNQLVFTFVWGYMAGLSGLAGHELIHKRESLNKAVGLLTYSKIFYSHFYLEHGSGHHRHVGTSDDPASARLGSTFYEYFPRTVYGGLRNTYLREIERIDTEFKEKCSQQDLSSGQDDSELSVPTLVLLYENRVVRFGLLHLGMLCAIYSLFGLQAVVFQLGYSFVGIFFIELINYVEHYGLRRHKDSRGIYEPITEKHSWNSSSGPLLFRIQRHSDHHMHSYRPYQILRQLDQAPQLPFDYLFSLLLALSPQAWFAAMNPLVSRYQVTPKANSQG